MIDPANHLLPAIERYRDCLARRVRVDNGEPLPADLDLAVFERTLDNTITEHFGYQTLQSQAFAMGRIGLADAQIIYIALGEAPGADGWAAGTDLATKLVVTSALAQLARRRAR